jgi:hypothetical protein
MHFIHYLIKALPYNQVVITLNEKATVRLFDEFNFHRYKMGKRAVANQQYQRTSSLNLQVPYKGQWHVVIEKESADDSLLKTVVSVI